MCRPPREAHGLRKRDACLISCFLAVLGSFVGADGWVQAAVLAKVEDASDAKSIAYACAELAALAASQALNARDVAGSLLRTCVVPKLGYMCRTVRPDLLLQACSTNGA